MLASNNKAVTYFLATIGVEGCQNFGLFFGYVIFKVRIIVRTHEAIMRSILTTPPGGVLLQVHAALCAGAAGGPCGGSDQSLECEIVLRVMSYRFALITGVYTRIEAQVSVLCGVLGL